MPSDPTDSSLRPAPVTGLLSLVIPVFNEQESLQTLHTEIDAVSKDLPDWRVEIVFVDDGSTDGSWNEIRKLSADPRVQGLRFRRNFGKAAALEAGFRQAAGEMILTLDADLQDAPFEIPRFLEAIQTGLDVVSGYKQIRHDPWHKVFPSRVFNRLVSTVTGVHLHDHNCGFKAYRAMVVRDLRVYGELHRYLPVLAAARGYTSGELVIHHRSRKFGRSKFGWKRFLKGFLDLVQVQFVTEYGWRPMHFFGTLAVIATAIAALGLIALPFASAFWVNLCFVVVLLAGGFAGQAILTGFLAELMTTRRTEDPYLLSEQVGSAVQRNATHETVP
jgi:glycosyltransferase involved in cell wall biosynthesis